MFDCEDSYIRVKLHRLFFFGGGGGGGGNLKVKEISILNLMSIAKLQVME